MEESEFLKYIYHEDLYLIDEPTENVDAKIEIHEETIKNEIQESIVEEPIPISFFGKNEKGILIIVNEPTNDLLNQSDLDLLMKIIESGLRFSKNDFALVNASKFSIDQILNEIEYQHLISFGAGFTDIYMDQTLYKCHNVDDKKILFSEELSVLAKDESKKRLLWNALKSMFNI